MEDVASGAHAAIVKRDWAALQPLPHPYLHWVNPGARTAVPVYPGGFVRRVAGTPHYDGARADASEPAVIVVSGDGPVGQKWVDPSQPVLRRW
jgi:hypothetical protein